MDQLRGGDPEMPEGLHDRACDNWRTLLAIADLVGGDWPAKARASARLLSGEDVQGPDEANYGIQLLADIREIIKERISTRQLVDSLNKMDERPWGGFRKGKGLDARRLARLLTPFGIRPVQLRRGTTNLRGYRRQDFEDAFARYLPSEPLQPLQATKTKAFATSRYGSHE